MPKMDLLGTYAYQGAYVGPGAGVEVPDDASLLTRIKEREQRARQRRDLQMQASAEQLPAGHPYKTLFAVNNSQPPQYEGEASPVGIPERALKTPPDGFNVSDPQSVASVLNALASLGITAEQIQQLQASSAGQGAPTATLPAWTPETAANASASTEPAEAPASQPSDGEAGSPAPAGSESSTTTADQGAAPPPAGSTSTPANGPRKSSGSSSSGS